MSAIYLLVVFALWVGLTWALWKLWRRWRTAENSNRRARDTLALVAGILWIGASFWYAGGKKFYYDMQVRELCAKDGGVKVYETVRLPGDKFDKWGMVNFYRPTQGEDALGPQYLLKTDARYLRQGDRSLRRYHLQVIRRLDGKVLGESTTYDLAGGDFPGPWQPSGFTCPEPSINSDVLRHVFIKE
jgi:hypothetical protein